jgi:hypothetical protein
MEEIIVLKALTILVIGLIIMNRIIEYMDR